MARPPNSELVAVAFLKTLHADLATNVATRLPTDTSSWVSKGFVVVSSLGGSQHPGVPWQRPSVQLDVYAVNEDADDPPWDMASDLASLICAAERDMTKLNQPLTLRAGYDQARVTGFAAQLPRRQQGDVANYAWYQIDAQIDWVPLV